jgi:hypothetical protein
MRDHRMFVVPLSAGGVVMVTGVASKALRHHQRRVPALQTVSEGQIRPLCIPMEAPLFGADLGFRKAEPNSGGWNGRMA